MKIPIRSSALLLVKKRMRPVACINPNTAATEVFLVKAMKTLARGGTTARNACGRTTCCID